MRFKALICLPLFLLLSSCYYLQGTPTPLATIRYPAPDSSAIEKEHRQLMVLVPGLGDRATAFAQHGVIQTIQATYPNMDVVAVEAHYKYYQAHTIIERLRQDVIKPALDAGYSEIILGGISLGGFGSLLYLKNYPNEINKVIILAPYLGDPEDYQYLIDNTAAPQAPRDVNLWQWLTQLPTATKEKIYLAYGTEDKFAVPNGLLAKQLPSEHRVTQVGKHHWKTWTQLWPQLLTNTAKH